MPRKKAIEDLWEVTLASVPGHWRKLLYFAKLRRKSPEKYTHWGFESKFGKEADSALRDAHASVYREVLRAPVSDLLKDCEENGAEGELLSGESADTMVPIRKEGQSESHFKYLRSTLAALLRSKGRNP